MPSRTERVISYSFEEIVELLREMALPSLFEGAYAEAELDYEADSLLHDIVTFKGITFSR
jgi:hypothetical protein